MKKLTVLLIGFAAIVTMLTYGFDFPFTENSTGLNFVQMRSPSPLNIQGTPATLFEGFEGGTIPAGWTATAVVGTVNWGVTATGSYPTCVPHTGTYMAWYNSFSSSAGNYATLVTPALNNSGMGVGDTSKVSFWMYQDPAYTTNYDSVGVWVNTSPSLTGATPLGNILRYNSVAGWSNFSYNLPQSFNGATNYVIFKAYSAYGNNMFVDDVSLRYYPTPMVYTSSTTTGNTAGVSTNTLNAQVIGIQVVMSGGSSPINLTQLNLNTNGTTSPPTDIANAKIFYTGLSSAFATTAQFGSAVASPNGAFSVSGTQALSEGINYFWLTYDVPSGATVGNFIDAECNSIVGSGTMGTKIPTVIAPPGSRKIDFRAYLSESFDGTTFPPAGWDTTIVMGTSTIQWQRSTAGSSPTCAPHSGAGMAFYNCYSISAGNAATLITPPVTFTGAGTNQVFVTFWMYGDPAYSTNYDSVGVWINTTPDLSGAPRSLGNVWRYNPIANWYYFSFPVPVSYNASTNYIIFRGQSYYGNNIFVDDVNIGLPANMTFSSITTSQNTASVVRGSTNNQVIGINLAALGQGNPLTVSKFYLNTTGTTNPAVDIANGKVFFTGTNPVFSGGTQFGTIVPSPNGVFSITGTATLANGNNYFWVTYDVPSGAIFNDYIDAGCDSVVGSWGTATPVSPSPPGGRQILGPLSGNYTVGNGMTYPSFTSAINELTARGVAGPVTFLVKPGIYGTDAGTEPDSTFTVATGNVSGVSATNTVTFKKKSDEIGNVWVERRGTSAATDYVIGLSGAKYTTFDSINVRQKDTTTAFNMLEWGYYITNPTVTSGSQYNTIINCQIYLKGSNSSTCGIWQYYTATPALASGSNSNNVYANNTIVNAYKGVELYGYGAPSPYNLCDLNNQIIGNTITGLGSGGLLSSVYGIYTYYQGNGFKILNNTIRSAPNHAYTFYGIYPYYGYDANVDINGNTININYNANYSCYGIYANYVGALSGATVNNRVNINYNTFNISLGPLFTSSAFYGIYAYYNYADTLNIIGNKFVNDTIPGSSTAYFIYPYYWGNNLNVSNDTISGVYKNGTGSLYPIYSYYSNFNNAKQKINNNYVNNLFVTAGSIYGIYSSPATTTTSYINNNVVSNFTTTTGSSLYGIYSTNSVTGYIYGNKINNLKNSYSSGTVYGVNAAGGTNSYYYNNFISNLRAPASASNPATVGFYVSAGTYNGIFNNSIYMADTSSSTSYGSAGIYLYNSYPIDLRNNNITNISKPGNSAFANKTVGIKLYASGYLTNLLSTSNYNNIYVGSTADTGRAIYFDASNRDFTLSTYKARVSPREQSTITENPAFINAPAGDLHISTVTPTLLYNTAALISSPVSVTTDIDSNARSNPFCDIGASEFAGTSATDIIPPSITYNNLGNGSPSNRNFSNVTITDPSGVNSTTNPPRVYYKKTTNANTIADNTSASNGWKYKAGTLSGSVFTFTIDYSILFGGSVTVGDSIQYFVVGQDNAVTPNVGINAGTFTTIPASVALTAANFPLLGTINKYAIISGGLANTVNVGTGQTYTTLTGAGGLFAAINSGVLTGNVNAVITSDLTEPGTNQLQPWAEQTTPQNFTISIRPDGTTVRNIFGWVSNAMIRLYGVNNVTIDGSFGGSGRYLRFNNRTVSSYPTIQLSNGCVGDTIKNCVIEGNNTSSSSGVVLIGTAYTTVPQQANNYNTISGNLISSRSDSLIATVPAVGICNYGSAAPLPLNSYNNILNNEIKNFSYYGINLSATGSGDGWVVKNNSLYYKQDAFTPAYTGVTMYGMYIMPGVYGSGYTIDSNYVGGSQVLAGGNYMDIKGLFNGIYASIGYNSVSTIRGNVLKNIRSTYLTANSTTFYGLAGVGGWMNITGNTVGSSDTAQRLQMNGSFRGIQASSSFFAGPAVLNCTYNTVNNIWTRPDSTIATLTLALNRYGIVLGGYLAAECSNNTVSNILNWQSPGATAYNVFTMGILPNAYNVTNVKNNTIYNIGNMVTTAPTGAGRILVYGIQPIAMGDNSVFSGNKISHIYSNTTGGYGDLVMGIYNAASYYGSTVTLANNQVTILDNSGAYSNVMGIIDVSGSYGGGTCNWYYNSVVLGGTSASGNPYNSYAYYKSTTVGVVCISNLQNNILYNFRTGGNSNHVSTGTFAGTKDLMTNKFPFAYDDENLEPIKYGNPKAGSTQFTSNYNLLVTSNPSMIGDWYGVLGNMNYWQTNSGTDANSYWDTVANALSTDLFKAPLTGNLNIDSSKSASILVADRGTPIAGITTDFNGFTRNAATPDIGSSEFTYTLPLASTLLSPENNSTGLENAVRLVWTKSMFAASYRLQIATDTTSGTFVVNTNVTDTTYSFLASNLKYYWRVNPVYAQYGNGPFSSVFNFSTLGTPTRVTLVAPVNGAVDLPVTIRFIWNKAYDGTPAPNRLNSVGPIDISSYFTSNFNKTAKTKTGNEKFLTGDNIRAVGNYLIRISGDTTAAPIYSDSTLTDTTTVLTGFPANQKFFWNVSAKNEFGWGATSVWFTATTIPMPGIPVAVSPPYDTTGMSTTPTLVWTRSFKAATYTVQMSTDSLFGTLLFSDSLRTDTVKAVSGLLKSTKYYWRVEAVNGAGISDWAGSRFTTASTPTPVTLVSPDNVINQPVGATVFQWRKLIIPNLAGYWLEATTDTVSGTPSMIDSTFGATDTSATKGGFAYFTNYYWRVKARNDFGWGDYSLYFNFQTELGPPNLVYPANNALGIVPTVTLDWDNAPGAVTYRMQLSADSTFTTTMINVSGLPTSLYTVPSGVLSILTNYFWRVNSTNAQGTSIYSSVFKFRTMGQPLSVNLVAPANNAVNIAALNTVFNWNKGVDQTFGIFGNKGKTLSNTEKTGNDGKELNSNNTGKTGNDLGMKNTGKITNGTDEITMVTKYWFELVTDTVAMAGLVQDTTLTDTTKTLTSLGNMTDYYFRVKGKNEIGWGSFSAWNKFTTTVALPTLLLPANTSTDVTLSPLLDWSDVSTATSYDLQVSTDAGFATLLYDLNGLPISEYAIPVPLNVFTNYYWRVRATNANGTSPYYSASFTFRTVPTAPLAPALLIPLNGSTGLTLPVALQWSKVNDAYTYRLQVATDAGFTALVFNDSTITDTSKVIPGLQPVTTYYWRVKSKNTAGTSAYSDTWNFRALGVPNPVTLLNPLNGAIDQPTAILFIWSTAVEPVARPLGGKIGTDGGKQSTDDPLTISKYYFELTRDTVTFVGIYRDSTTTDTTLNVGGLLTNRDYFWRVKAQNQTGNGSFTGWSRFKTIVANPIVPVLVLPANNAVNQLTTVIFQWRKVNDNVDLQLGNKTNKSGTDNPVGNKTTNSGTDEITAISKYYFELTPDTVTFAGIYRDSTVAGPSDTTLTRAGLINNTAYFWRVRA
ncbi:MAG: hypothetical protein NTV87_14770, partial [Ignavibacteriae bacterium]|nr:hypothetical protein [Ignavibacteriota bacterium]